jgi:hypothetical protein
LLEHEDATGDSTPGRDDVEMGGRGNMTPR